MRTNETESEEVAVAKIARLDERVNGLRVAEKALKEEVKDLRKDIHELSKAFAHVSQTCDHLVIMLRDQKTKKFQLDLAAKGALFTIASGVVILFVDRFIGFS